ncbi:MAG: transketolase C-terminal domain-containing protein [Gammaproteobacteria bacterium]|jgi:pyruvate dehydrogenase E1 component beta subunit|nr:transketolase C-terminal domain-containing protein [Gammaproteobacteria bacterium]|tara:strand:+ start:2794 stop:3879 length:1086 start_codon:yes stop_codon:yes gene_type:complete
MHRNITRKIRKISYSKAIREGIDQVMQESSNLVVIGEGVPDPKSIFLTTEGLREKYGKKRVFDMPLAENGMTGICIGAAIDGTRVLMIHQRIDFALLAMDQIINNAAKWHYMFDGQMTVPIVIRVIIGRGWGQGPQHSQGLQALFAHIPGLKVIMPATAKDAKGMMITALRDNNPVIFIEHRWLHHIEDDVPEEVYGSDIDKAQVIRRGSDVTIVASSLMVMESLKVAKVLSEIDIDMEVVDLRSVRPIDINTIMQSVVKTKKIIVVDAAWKAGGIAGEIVAQVVDNGFDLLERAPLRISLPEHPVPTSHYMADYYYQDAKEIAEQVMEFFGYQGNKESIFDLLNTGYHRDVPTKNFHGPF